MVRKYLISLKVNLMSNHRLKECGRGSIHQTMIKVGPIGEHFPRLPGNYQKDSTKKIWVWTLFLDLISGFYPIFNA